MTFNVPDRPREDQPWEGGTSSPQPGGLPGSEPADPWAEDAARRQAEEDALRRDEGWTSEPGGMGPIPSRTWRRGGTTVTVGGCCLPLPLGCLTTVLAAGAVAVSAARRTR